MFAKLKLGNIKNSRYTHISVAFSIVITFLHLHINSVEVVIMCRHSIYWSKIDIFVVIAFKILQMVFKFKYTTSCYIMPAARAYLQISLGKTKNYGICYTVSINKALRYTNAQYKSSQYK